MTGYEEDIIEATGCSPQDAVMVEHIMREDIFHSTLDWLTKAQFNRAAHKAVKMLAADRETYEEYFRLTRAAFQELRADNEARARAIAYEI